MISPALIWATARTAPSAVVVDRGDVGQADRVGDQIPQPTVPLADLGLRHVMAASGHPVADPLHSYVFRHDHRMQRHGVARGARRVDQAELGGMAEHRLNDERTS